MTVDDILRNQIKPIFAEEPGKYIYTSAVLAPGEFWIKEEEGDLLTLNPDYHKVTNPASLMKVVDHVSAVIKDWLHEHPEVSHIAVTGVSGQSVGWPLSYKLNIPLLVVRKSGERSHGVRSLIGHGQLTNYVILDDMIESGATIRAIWKSVKEGAATKRTLPECKAIFLFRDGARAHPFELRPESWRCVEKEERESFPDIEIPVIASNVASGY